MKVRCPGPVYYKSVYYLPDSIIEFDEGDLPPKGSKPVEEAEPVKPQAAPARKGFSARASDTDVV
jgi:hypothetical protein